MKIHDDCFQAGVVGAGGAGFPTHVKLNCKADIVLANGAECEPLLRVDQQMMLLRAADVVRGLKLAMKACGAKEGVICIKAKHKEAIQALEKACSAGVSVFQLKDYYPAGDEQQMVYDATGRIVPVGGIPIDAGVVVQNVSTLLNILAASKGVPVTHKYLTVTGEVRSPMTIQAPIGMSFRDCIRLAGGPAREEGYGLIVGGPMMGYVEKNWDNVVTKTTGGLIVLPADHPHLLKKAAPATFNRRMAKVVCCQCMQCTAMCPRNSLGLGVKPHMAMRATAYGGEYRANGLFSCCNCGLCSYYACPFGLSPSTIMTEMKNAMAAAGVRPEKTPGKAAPYRDYAKVPVKRLVMRLGLKKYDVPAPILAQALVPGQVRIPLKMHIGAPCEPVVKPGDPVEVGTVIGRPPEGKLGVLLHASISGTVQSVDPNCITINK